jgi:hypothetical protein
MCGSTNAQSGTVLSTQTPGDCRLAICDGNGNTTTIPDNNDVASDNNECTTDGCSAGSPTHVPVTAGTPCTTGGGKVCSVAGTCVECASGTDCATGVCKNNICIAAQCNDTVKNGSETDVDCGGGTCPQCAFNKLCGSDSDCKGGSCVGSHCAATCTDGTKNGSETDTDCGGGCGGCENGKACSANADCLSGKCTGGTCDDVLVISELQTRGSAQGNDEFIELYNPTNGTVIFDNTWTLSGRSASTTLANCANVTTVVKFTGSGQVVGPHRHFLITKSAGYDGAIVGDATYTSGFSDGGSLVLKHGNAVVDALCFYFNSTSQSVLTGCSVPYVCEGTPVSNAPHTDSTGVNSDVDVSIERRPGGAGGNMQDTNDNAADFVNNTPANPQNLASAATP